MNKLNPGIAIFIILSIFILIVWVITSSKDSSTTIYDSKLQESSIRVLDKEIEINYTDGARYTNFLIIGTNEAVYICSEEIWNSLEIGRKYKVFESGMGYGNRLTIESVVIPDEKITQEKEN